MQAGTAPFRIAIDVRRIQDFGVGTYIRNLVRSLAALDRTNRYVLVRGPDDIPELAALPSNFETAVYERRDSAAAAQLTFPFFLKNLAADVYHVPLNAVPLWMPRPYIVTIHDMANILFTPRNGIANNLRLFRLRRGLLRANSVIAVSESTRRDLEGVVGVPAERIRTIYNAPDPAFRERHAPPVACITEQSYQLPPDMQRTLDRYSINYPFLLYAGRTAPHKNIGRIVEAFAVVKQQFADHPIYHDLRLIIIGDELSRHPALRHVVRNARVHPAIRFLGFVPIETLRVFYQAATTFVFPSLYEGFGLPPLEAMACGTPVVTSHVSSLPEVVGDAAIIVNPENVFDIARGIREVLLDAGLRNRLVERGAAQVRKFTWSRTAEQVLESYYEVAGVKRQARAAVP